MAPEPGDCLLRAGSIKRVHLTNFMCHSELSVDFGSQVSFVTGHNGSGKSAILAAIVAGLGARANVTSRGTKLSDLVKNGELSSTVLIHIHNAGDDPEPFQPRVYGETIQLERVFHKEKSATYKIMSSSGKVISRKRHELDQMLDHFGIQVNNPVFLMNQDTCRSFLNSKSGKDFYSFFYKAPLLDEMEEVIRTTQVQTQEAGIVVGQKEEELDPIKDAIKKWEEKQQKCLRPEKVQKDIDNVKLEMKIKEYQALKATVDTADNAAREADENLHRQETALRRKEEKIPVLQDEIDKENTAKQELIPNLKESEEAIENAKPVLRDVREKTLAAQRKFQESNDELKEKRRNLTLFERQLQKARNEDGSEDLEQKRIELERQIEEARHNMVESSAQRQALQSERQQLEEETGRTRAEHDKFMQNFQAVKRSVEELDVKIQKYQGASNSSGVLNRLGQLPLQQKQVMDDLIKRKVLKGELLGPCVLLMSLKDEAYGKAVQKAVGHWFQTYLLEDERDRSAVLKAFQDARVPVPTLDCALGSGKKFPTSEFPLEDSCESPYPTVMSLLSFAHPYVRNVVVDACGLHQMIVMPTIDAARQYFRDQQPYRNCELAFDISGNTHSKDADGYSFVPSDERLTVLCANFDAQIENLKVERAEKLQVLDSKKNLRLELEGKVKKLQQELPAKQKQIQNLQDSEGRLQIRLNNWMKELEAVRTAEPTDIQALLDEVDELRTAVENVVAANAIDEQAYQAAKARETKAENKFKVMKEQAQEEVKRLDEVQARIENYKIKKDRMEDELRNSKTTLANALKIVTQKRQNAERAHKEHEEAKNALLAVGVDERRLRRQTRGEDELEELLNKFETLMRNINADVENSWEYCQEKLDELNESKKAVESQLETARKAVVLMQRNAKLRRENFESARDKASGIVCECFSYAMKERSYEGSIELDHEAKTLTFHVQPRPGAQDQDSNVKSLSGGERSFTMVCFLIALWELIAIPFRVLDEFDVFMDMLNRDHAMTRLIGAAVDSGRQFIFLTPLAFSQEVLDGFKDSQEVEVIRMPTVKKAARQVDG